MRRLNDLHFYCKFAIRNEQSKERADCPDGSIQ